MDKQESPPDQIIRIATVEPYEQGQPPRNPVVTGTRAVKAKYVRGILAAHPTSYAELEFPEDDPDDYSVTHLPSGAAFIQHITREAAMRLVDAWQTVKLDDFTTYDEAFRVRRRLARDLRAAAERAGVTLPGRHRA